MSHQCFHNRRLLPAVLAALLLAIAALTGMALDGSRLAAASQPDQEGMTTEQPTGSAVPGEAMAFVVTVTNPGNAPDIYDLATEVYLPAVYRSHCLSSPTWQTGAGLAGKTVYALAATPGDSPVLYAGTAGDGVFKSTDQGATWQQTALDDTLVFALVAVPSDPLALYAATWGAGVLRTTDGGGSWHPLNAGLAAHLYLNTIELADPTGPVLYAGTADGGVYITRDGGGLWAPAITGLDGNTILSLAVDPNYPQVVYAGTADKGVYETTTAGASWVAANTGLETAQVWRIVVDPASGSDGRSRVLYAATGTAVFKSENAASTWVRTGPAADDLIVYGLALDPRNTQHLYAGTAGDGVYATEDGGQSWQTLDDGLGSFQVQWLTFSSATCPVLYASSGDGVWWLRP